MAAVLEEVLFAALVNRTPTTSSVSAAADVIVNSDSGGDDAMRRHWL